MSSSLPDTRTLPIPVSHREFTIIVNGEELAREHQLLSASIVKVVNRIASARLGFADGNAASSEFPLSASDLFVPGAEIEVRAGSNSAQATLFSGIVIRHSVRVRAESSPQLLVECRHRAVKLATVPRDAVFIEQTDSGIIESLVANAGISADVESTSTTHQQVLQYRATDWDFLLARASASGLLVIPKDDGLIIRRPSLDSSASVTFLFGATMLEFDAEIDARLQHSTVVGMAWDPAQQAVVSVDAAAPGIEGPGNLEGNDLATVASSDRLEIRQTPLSEEEAQTLVNAEWTRSRLNKVTGRAKCEGIGTVNPGEVVTIEGVSARFNGDVFVTGVRHDFDLVQGWKTHIQFGGVEGTPRPRQVVGDESIARMTGLQIGVVVSNEDPDGEHRVRVRLPIVSVDDDGIWARVASLDAGSDRGFFFRPEIGDEVVVGFIGGDARAPLLLGMLHSSAKAAPLAGSDDNHEKLYKSRAGMVLSFNDETKVMRLETPAGNSVVLSEDEKSIVIADQNGNSISLSQDGITIESSKALTLKSGTETVIEAQTSLATKGGTELKLEGTSKAELSSSGTTKISGSLVQIN